MCKKRLDMRERMPGGMEEYLDSFGWHFNKKLCEWAVSKMQSRTGETMSADKDQVDNFLKRYGLNPSSYNGYDAVYVFAMAKSDYFGSSIADESHLALFVKDYLEDKDGYDEIAMTRFYADCIGKGEMPSWEDMI